MNKPDEPQQVVRVGGQDVNFPVDMTDEYRDAIIQEEFPDQTVEYPAPAFSTIPDTSGITIDLGADIVPRGDPAGPERPAGLSHAYMTSIPSDMGLVSLLKDGEDFSNPPLQAKGKPHTAPPLGHSNIPGPEVPPEDLELGGLDTFIAGQMKYNPIVAGSVNLQEWVTSDEDPIPGYSSFQDGFERLAGYPYELFTNSQSPLEDERIKRQYDRDSFIERTINETGWQGVAGAVGGGLANPIYLLPYVRVGAGLGLSATTIPRVASAMSAERKAAMVANMKNAQAAYGGRIAAAEGLIGEAITEAAYHSLDLDMKRTVDESMFNMTAGALAGGVLGTVLKSRAMTPQQYKRALNKLVQEHSDVADLRAVTKAMGPGEDNVVSSLVTDTAEIAKLSGLRKAISKVTPLRILASENPLARKLGALLGEQNVANTVRASVETLIKKHDGNLTRGIDQMRLSYRKMGARGLKMDYDAYGDLVAKANRNGDISEIPEIQEAAQALRKHILDPMEREAKAAGLLNNTGKEATDVPGDTELSKRLEEANKKSAEAEAKMRERFDKKIAKLRADSKARPKIRGTAAQHKKELSEAVKEVKAQLKEALAKHRASHKAFQATLKKVDSTGQATAEATEKAAREELIKLVAERKKSLDDGLRQIHDEYQVEIDKLREEAKVEISDKPGQHPKRTQMRIEARRKEIKKKIEELKVEGKKAIDDFRANHLKETEVLKGKHKFKTTKSASKAGKEAYPNKTAESYYPRQYNFDYIQLHRGRIIQEMADEIHSLNPNITREEAMDAANQALRRIDDSDQTAKHYARDVKFVAGPLKGRTLMLDDDWLADHKMLINDPETVLRSWGHDMATHLEMNRMFGNTDMVPQFEEVIDAWDNIINEASLIPGNESKVAKLAIQKNDDVEVLNALRDRIFNRYALPKNSKSQWVRIGRGFRNMNVLRLLGGMTMSAFPDLARPLYRHGLARYANALHSLAFNSAFRNMAFADMKRMGVATEMVLHGRLRAIVESDFLPMRTSRPEAWVENMVNGRPGGGWDFGKVSLMSQWNTSTKTLSGVMAQDGLIAHLGKNLKYGKKLAQHGIPPDMVKRMKDMLKIHGTSVEDLRFANSDLWEDLGAAELFEATILREVDATIVTPGIMDKPLWTSSEGGKIISQFKSFGFAATNKQLLSSMNHFDQQILQGLLVSVALGALTYTAKRKVAGQDPATLEDDPTTLLAKAIDYSGVIGIGGEAIALSMAAASAAGIYKGDGNSRYAQQGLMGALAGPSADLGSKTLRAGRLIFKEEPNAGDVQAARSMIPYNNLIGVRNIIFDPLEKAVKDYYNIVE